MPPLRAKMRICATMRWLIWGWSLAFVLLGARAARAAAPMCDEKGASVIAPSPVLPIRDVRIEEGSPVGCDDTLISVTPMSPGARSHSVLARESLTQDAWMKPPGPSLFHRSSTRAPATVSEGRAPAQDHRPTVFRPPRF